MITRAALIPAGRGDARAWSDALKVVWRDRPDPEESIARATEFLEMRLYGVPGDREYWNSSAACPVARVELPVIERKLPYDHGAVWLGPVGHMVYRASEPTVLVRLATETPERFRIYKSEAEHPDCLFPVFLDREDTVTILIPDPLVQLR